MSAQPKFTRRQALKLMGVGTFSAYLAACAAPAGSSDMADSEMPAGEKKTISISHIGGGSVEASEKSQRMMLLRANFPDIEFENRWVSYAGYLDKIPVQIASGDLADLQFCNAFNDIPLMMENQIIIETGPLLEQFGKNILAVTPEPAWASTIYDGKQYAVTHNVYDLNNMCAHYRADWLDKLGLGLPQTIDEYGEVMRAFSHGDPDGNGQDDTYGRLLYNSVRFDDDFFHAFGVAVGHHLNGFWRDRDGRLELDWVQPGMKDALAWMSSVWADGGFHPDSISIPLGQKDNAFHAGIAGNVYSGWPSIDFAQNKIRAVAPDAVVMAGPAPEGPGGSGYTGEGWPWTFVIPITAQWPEDCVSVIDWFFTPDVASQILCEGVLGVTNKGLNENGWCVEYTPEEKAAMGDEWTQKQNEVQDINVFWGLWLTIGTLGGTQPFPTFPPDMKKHFDDMLAAKYSENALAGRDISQEYRRLTAKARPVSSEKEFWPTLQTRFGEFISQAVAGTIDIDQGWSEWLDFFEKNGGPLLTEQVNEI
ncbi:MAG: extracellular solute-binding protein [Caldilineaceae bacterium SB0670_bin_27]|uniref:Extracellular solute-binding protein n=1 Tax=Caldilineaceae bacterium SB0664_bin_27 TaxID=2605260 RepID=A0A6B0YSY1_9CHLR|nr:extracellular solute-binding protein [Caldilineaceae bacterium SB0664_bin_27]MYJ78276.1 extracellular solute-binding protein [Caldilineaceae bacterium SB0670_bin_27]